MSGQYSGPSRTRSIAARIAGARRWLIAPLVLMLALAPSQAYAGVVVVLKSRAIEAFDAAAAGFRAAHHDSVVELTLGEGSPEPIITRVLSVRPDAIVAIGARAARLAHDRLPQIPLVLCAVPPPERMSLHGDALTGVTIEIAPSTALQALRAVAPDVRRVAVFYAPSTGLEMLRAARAGAATLGLTLVEVPVPALDQLAPRAQKAIAEADAMWLPPDPEIAAPEAFRFLLDLSLRTRKPLFAFSEQLVRAGALAAVVPDWEAAGAQAAEVMARLEAGADPNDLPLVGVRRTRIVINRTTASVLGRRLPDGLPLTAEVLP